MSTAIQLPYRRFRIPTDEDGVRFSIRRKADFFHVGSFPAACNLVVNPGTDEEEYDLPAEQYPSFKNCMPWAETFFTWDAVAGGIIDVVIGFGCETAAFGSQAQLITGDVGIEGGDALLVGSGTASSAAAGTALGSGSCRSILLECPPASPESLLWGVENDMPNVIPAGGGRVIPASDLELIFVRSDAGTALYTFAAVV